MNEAVQIGIEHRRNLNVGDLMVDRLGIGFENPPLEIPMTLMNRLKNMKMAFGFNSDGQFDGRKNVILYRADLGEDELFTRGHELIHALCHEINPEYFESAQRLRHATMIAPIRIGPLRLFTKFDNEMTLNYTNDCAKDLSQTEYILSEGIAIWGAAEIISPSDSLSIETHEKVKGKIEDQLAKAHFWEDQVRLNAYLGGHQFVQDAMGSYEALGISKGAALIDLMRNPPLRREELSAGGFQHVQGIFR